VSREDKEVGIVEEVQLDPISGHLQGIIVRIGGTLERLFAGGTMMFVPQRLIRRVENSTVHLHASEEEIKNTAKRMHERHG